MPKQIYSWNRVKAGDIISFRYESKAGSRLTTILVLNQKLLVSRMTFFAILSVPAFPGIQ